MTLFEIIHSHKLKVNSFSKCLVKPRFVRIHFRHQITWGIGLNTGLKRNRTVRFIGNRNSRVVGSDPGSNCDLTHPYVGCTLLSAFYWGKGVKFIRISCSSGLAGRGPHRNPSGNGKFSINGFIVQSQVGKAMSPETNNCICVNCRIKITNYSETNLGRGLGLRFWESQLSGKWGGKPSSPKSENSELSIELARGSYSGGRNSLGKQRRRVPLMLARKWFSRNRT